MLKREDFVVGKQYKSLASGKIRAYIGPSLRGDKYGVFYDPSRSQYVYDSWAYEDHVLYVEPKSGIIWVHIYENTYDRRVFSCSSVLSKKDATLQSAKLLRSFELPWTEDVT